MAGSNGTLPGPLARAARQFAKWRSRNWTRRRIPEDFWNQAADLAGRYGLNRTALALRLDYYRLKHRTDRSPRQDPKERAAPSRFVEILPASPAPAPGCLVEIEVPSGARMKIHLRGDATVGLVALGQLFLEGRA